MLMNEWRRYRDRQIRKAIRSAREDGELLTPDEASVEDGDAPSVTRATPPMRDEKTAAPAAGDVQPPPDTLENRQKAVKSGAEEPKDILSKLNSSGGDVREKLELLRARQQVLPLDVDEMEQPRSRSSRAEESREELVQRLLDPVLTLNEAATLLDVCTTTVRRYTNRGILKCYRTPGNQRRFRLSEIMKFMERRQIGGMD